MAKDRTILITGVTGNQGGAVAQALQGTGLQAVRHLRGLLASDRGKTQGQGSAEGKAGRRGVSAAADGLRTRAR